MRSIILYSFRNSKEEDILHPLGHLLLRLGDDFTTHGFLFKAAKYNFLEFSTHGSNPQALFLSYQLISVALVHGSNFHPAAVYVPNSFEHIIILPKRNIHPDIFIYFGFIGSHRRSQDVVSYKNQKFLYLLLSLRGGIFPMRFFLFPWLY